MIIYYLMIISITVILFLFRNTKNEYIRDLLYFLIGIILILIAGLRYEVGTDYVQYMLNYYDYARNDLPLSGLLGVHFIGKIANALLDDYAMWFFCMSLLTIVPVMKCIRQYSYNISYSVILYILLGCWHFSFNLVKQCAAASIILCGIGALEERNFRKWTIYCLIAAIFHITALLMIPIYFLVYERLNTKKVLLLLGFSVLVYYSNTELMNVISILKQDSGMVGVYSDTLNNSVNNFRVAINFFPMILFFFLKDNNNSYKSDNRFNCLLNISLLNSCLNLSTANSIYFYRFCVYTNIFNILFIPSLFNMMNSRLSKLTKYVILIIYLIFWSFDLYKGSTTVEYNWVFSR